jgi:hypothetical protein
MAASQAATGPGISHTGLKAAPSSALLPWSLYIPPDAGTSPSMQQQQQQAHPAPLQGAVYPSMPALRSLFAPPDARAVIAIIMADDEDAFHDCVLPAVLPNPEPFSKQLQEQDAYRRSLLQLLLTSKEWMYREYHGKDGSGIPGQGLWKGEG